MRSLVIDDEADARAWQQNCDARSTRLPPFYCHPALVLIERIEALRNILEPDSVRSSIPAVEFQDTDCGSDAVIFHSPTHMISAGLCSDPQWHWTTLPVLA